MYKILLYEDRKGHSELEEQLTKLSEEADTNKDSRIQFEQIILYVELLQKRGTNLSSNITKYLDNDLWELRPGKNRIFYFQFNEKTFVLLHMFRKKSQKTPKLELERAYREIEDYRKRIWR